MHSINRKSLRWTELFVVTLLALIGLAFLSPGLIYRRESGYRLSCQGNEAKLARGFLLYVTDYGGYFPIVNSGIRTGRPQGTLGKSSGWANSIESYIQNPDVFQCPSVNAPIVPGHVDYGYNVTIAGASESTITATCDTVLAFEASPGDGTNLTASVDNTAKVVKDRHLDGSNYAFTDGHVKWLQSTRYPTTFSGDCGFWFAS